MSDTTPKISKFAFYEKVKNLWLKIVQPSILWLSLLTFYYLGIGIIMFPSWWKRAIFGGEIFQLKFISFGTHFLIDLFLTGHPLGVSLVVLFVIATSFLIYNLGRISFQSGGFLIQRPRTSSLIVSLLFACGMILSLQLVRLEYKTPEEVQGFVQTLQNEAEEPFAQMLGSSAKGPASGYFFYLDSEKISRIFNSLREEFRLSSQTSTTTSEKSASFEAAARGIKIDASGKLVKEESFVRVPVEATPEREAQYLIGYFVKTTNSDFYYENSFGGSKKVKLAKDWLQEKGVILTEGQEKTLKDGFRNSFVNVVNTNTPNFAPVCLTEGQYTLFMESNSFRVKFDSLGEIGVRLNGVLSSDCLDSSVRAGILKNPQGITMNGKILALEWKRERIGQEFIVDLIPLAIW